jgi:hypothetical protein
MSQVVTLAKLCEWCGGLFTVRRPYRYKEQRFAVVHAPLPTK